MSYVRTNVRCLPATRTFAINPFFMTSFLYLILLWGAPLTAVVVAYRSFGGITAFWLSLYLLRKVIAFSWVPALSLVGYDYSLIEATMMAWSNWISSFIALSLVVFVFRCGRQLTIEKDKKGIEALQDTRNEGGL